MRRLISAVTLRSLGAIMLGLALALTGCGKGAAKTSNAAQQEQIIQSASPAVQAAWQLAVAAAATNDYATSILTLRRLQGNADLTPDQRTAIAARLEAVNAQLTAGLQQGDAAATKAMQTMQQQGRTR